jgi:hypothetical protein
MGDPPIPRSHQGGVRKIAFGRWVTASVSRTESGLQIPRSRGSCSRSPPAQGGVVLGMRYSGSAERACRQQHKATKLRERDLRQGQQDRDEGSRAHENPEHGLNYRELLRAEECQDARGRSSGDQSTRRGSSKGCKRDPDEAAREPQVAANALAMSDPTAAPSTPIFGIRRTSSPAAINGDAIATGIRRLPSPA